MASDAPLAPADLTAIVPSADADADAGDLLPAVVHDDGAPPGTQNLPEHPGAVYEEDVGPTDADTVAALATLKLKDPAALAWFCDWYARDGWGDVVLEPSPATAERLRLAQGLLGFVLDLVRSRREDVRRQAEEALRVRDDDRVGVMEHRARVVEIIEERLPHHFVEPDEGDDDLLGLVARTRKLVEFIDDLAQLHWRFGQLEAEDVAELFESDLDALGVASKLSVRVRAFGDDDEQRAREVYRKALNATKQRAGEEGANAQARRGRRPRRGPAG